MNSRERLLKAFNHEEPDKVPLDLGGHISGIHIKAYEDLLEYLDIEDKEIKTYDFAQQLAVPCDALLERFNIDTRYIHPQGDIIRIEDFKPQYVDNYIGDYDQFGVFWGNAADKELDDILYYDPVIHPFSDFKTVQEIENYDWPDGKNKALFEGLNEYAKKLRQ